MRTGSGTGRIFLTVIALVVYASLHPWRFHSRQLAASPLWLLLHSWPGQLNLFFLRDMAVNILGYVPLGLFGFLMLAGAVPGAPAAALTILLGLVLSGLLEMIQLFDAARTCSTLDLVCNTTGTAIGVALAHAQRAFLTRAIARPGFRAVVHPSGPTALLLCWAGYLTFPPLPLLSRTRLAAKLAAFWSASSFSAVEAAAGIVDWLTVAWLLEASGAKEDRRPLLGLILLVPARLLIAGRAVTLSECAGAAVAFVVWSRWPARGARGAALLAWLSVGGLVLRGLAPFHFSDAPGAFSWAPFSASLASEPGSAAAVLLRKTFLYGSAAWLFRAAGFRFVSSLLGLALLLGTIEAVQIYLPGRSAEITDPLLLLIAAAMLRLSEPANAAGAAGAATSSGCSR